MTASESYFYNILSAQHLTGTAKNVIPSVYLLQMTDYNSL